MEDLRIAAGLIQRWLLLGGLLLPAVMAYPQSRSTLPDAPQPAMAAGWGTASRAGGDEPGQERHRRWSSYIDENQAIRPLTVREKMAFWLHLEVEPYAPLPSLMGASFEQGIDGNPKFGTNSGAFGERVGAAFLRDASMRFFVSSAFPVVLHEDPRYYRMAREGTLVRRGLWAAEQALVTHADSGRMTANYSDLLGHLAACELTLTYYPAVSANQGVVAEAWATSIAGDAGNNLLLEFVPSIVSRWRRYRARVRARSSERRRSSSIP